MMNIRLLTLVLLITLGAPAVATPVVTLGPPVVGFFSTVDPGSIRVDMIGAGDTVELQVSMTIHPFCIRPVNIGLATTGDGGTFSNQTGELVNGCGGQTSVFNIRFTGDGIGHIFDLQLVDIDSGSAMVSIPVQLFSGSSPVVTLGAPITDSFSTVSPSSIHVEMLGAGDTVDLQVSMTIHPFCVRPFNIDLVTTDLGGTLTNQTGVLENNCGGQTSVFDIRLTGDGIDHLFDIQLVDADFGGVLVSIPVEIFSEAPPVVTLGAPITTGLLTVDPGSIRVEMLDAGNLIDLQLSLTIHPLCVRPFEVGLVAPGNGGTFTDLTGNLSNVCGDDTSVFNIRFAGDGLLHAFDIQFVDAEFGGLLASIPVELFPGAFDTDNDGVSNLTDNCIEVANTDQFDSNTDRIGNICDADITGLSGFEDCRVNFLDLQAIKIAFFTTPSQSLWNPHADFDNSGSINFADLQVMKDQFFGQPGPSATGCN